MVAVGDRLAERLVERMPRDATGRREVTVLHGGSTEAGATTVGATGEPGGSASA